MGASPMQATFCRARFKEVTFVVARDLMRSQRPPADIPPELLTRAQAFVDRKYTARADERQRSMGLAYVEAERQDLAREIARFTQTTVKEIVDQWLEKSLAL